MISQDFKRNLTKPPCLFSRECQIWLVGGFTASLLCDLNVHQHCKVRTITNQHFYTHVLQTERARKGGRAFATDGFYLSCWGTGMGIVSKIISEGKEGKQIAHFEISDPNGPIISMRALPLHKQSSLFVQVCLCCFRAPWFSWWGTFHWVIMQQFGWLGQRFSRHLTNRSTRDSKEAETENTLVPFEDNPSQNHG